MNSFMEKFFDNDYNLSIKNKLIFPVIFLIFINLVLLKFSNIEKSFLFNDQVLWVFIGILVFFFVSFLKIDFIYQHSFKFLFVILFLLLITSMLGSVVNNSRRWLNIGFLFQPSEIGKVLFVLFSAKLLSNFPKSINDFKIISLSLLPTFLVSFMIFRQPDLGTSLVYIFLIFPMLFYSGINFSSILIFLSPIISFLIAFIYEFIKNDLVLVNETYFFVFFVFWLSLLSNVILRSTNYDLKYKYLFFCLFINLLVTLATKFLWNIIIATYWFDRIKAFLNPGEHKRDLAWQINSSYDAIGSGGLLGKGLGNGMLTEFKMMPIYESDFIVSALAEQYGFAGIIVLISVLVYFFYWLITYLEKCLNQYEQLVLVGFSSIWFFHFIINLCIVSGLFPVTGLPFPFLSYGGTHFITNCIMLAITNKIISLHISN